MQGLSMRGHLREGISRKYWKQILGGGKKECENVKALKSNFSRKMQPAERAGQAPVQDHASGWTELASRFTLVHTTPTQNV